MELLILERECRLMESECKLIIPYNHSDFKQTNQKKNVVSLNHSNDSEILLGNRRFR